MYRIELDMGISEYAVRAAIGELRRIKGRDAPISQQEIAEHISCSERTVRRACQRLQASGLLAKQGSPRKGYQWNLAEAI